MKASDLREYARLREDTFRSVYLGAHRFIEAYQARHKARQESQYDGELDQQLQVRLNSLRFQTTNLESYELGIIKKANRSGKKR